MLHTLRFSLQNAVYFVMLPFLVPVLFTFYVQHRSPTSTTKNVSFLKSREYFGLVVGVHNYRHEFLSQILSHKGPIHSQCAVLLCDVFPDGKTE